MTIMRIVRRLILQNPSASSSTRWLSTLTEKSTAATEKVTEVTEKATAASVTHPKKESLLFYKASQANSKSSVAEILNNWVDKGNVVDRHDLVNLSYYFRGRRSYQAAIQLYDWMETNKVEINNSDQAIRINLLCKAKDVDAAEKYFNSLQASEKTTKTYGALLGCYCKEKLSDKALELFEEMKVNNYTSTLNYNSLLSLYNTTEQIEKVVSLAQEMEEKNITLDLKTYNILINSYAAEKNLDAIEGVLEKMKSTDVEIDLPTYGNLATIYLNCGLHEKANDFLQMMENMKDQPKRQVFESCRVRIKLYSEMNNLSGVNRAWETLKSTFPTLSNTNYLVVLLALSKLGDRENLEKLFKEWDESCSGYYDYRLPNVLLGYYLSWDMIEEASSLYEKLGNKETKPNFKTLDLFATLCIKKGEIDTAMKYLKTGLDKTKSGQGSWFPTDETIELFVNYFVEKNDAERSQEFIQIMKQVNRFDPNSLLSKCKASDLGI